MCRLLSFAAFHEAKVAGARTVTVWGTGTPRREFLAVDDLADACVFVMKHYSDDRFLNVGTGEDVSIAEFARFVADVVGYSGEIAFDTSRPDGAPQKLLDVSRLTALGWRATIPLRQGLLRPMRTSFDGKTRRSPKAVGGDAGWPRATSRSRPKVKAWRPGTFVDQLLALRKWREATIHLRAREPSTSVVKP
jgi:hypothetical protein